MTAVCFYFQVHQPMRLRRLQLFKPPQGFDYWDHAKNKAIIDRVSEKCYLPTNRTMLDLIEQSDGWFRIAYSLSGVFLEQLERSRPDVLASFQALVKTGHVEILDETYYHSLAGLWDDQREYGQQIQEHRAQVKRLLGVEPVTFRNTELIYDNRIASTVESLGYESIMTEGTEKILGERSPNYLYRPQGAGGRLKVLLKNYRLSDDVAFRFSSHDWKEFPLTADKYARWLAQSKGQTINLFMDYETFGEHQWPQTGIFEFLKHLPSEVRKHKALGFALPREVVKDHEPVGTIEVPNAISWADTERDVSAWLHNKMQHACFEELKAMASTVAEIGDPDLTHAWRLLQTSDHLYYCTTKNMGDQDIHTYFSPYDSPYIAFVNYMNAIEDLKAKATQLIRR
jgi:alpha-amylase